MTKELSKSIMTRSRIKNKYNKWLSRENFQALKQIMNKNVRDDDVITLKEKGRLINDELEVAETVNSHYYKYC